MQERSRKIWKQNHRAQSPTAMFWSLGCRPMAWATPVMPMRSPGDKLWPEPQPRQLVIWSMTHVPAHAASHWVLTEPWGWGATDWMPSKAQKVNTLVQGHIANCQESGF